MRSSQEYTDLQPYLNPTYWDNQGINLGPTETWPDSNPMQDRFGTSKTALEDRLRGRDDFTPIATFVEGDLFHAGAYNPGTLIAMRMESLSGTTLRAAKVNYEELATQPLPERPIAIVPEFGLAADTVALDEKDGLSYLSTVRWGVVAHTSGGRPIVNSVAAVMMRRLVTNIKVGGAQPLTATRPPITIVTVESTQDFTATRSPIAIGRTRHYATVDRKRERLERINVLQVIALGDRVLGAKGSKEGFWVRPGR